MKKKEVKMTIKEIAKAHGISNRELARRCGIPIRTVENWSSGAATPPDYILTMIDSHLKLKSMEHESEE